MTFWLVLLECFILYWFMRLVGPRNISILLEYCMTCISLACNVVKNVKLFMGDFALPTSQLELVREIQKASSKVFLIMSKVCRHPTLPKPYYTEYVVVIPNFMVKTIFCCLTLSKYNLVWKAASYFHFLEYELAELCINVGSKVVV